MPPVFTRQFAARLDSLCASTVLEASGGEDLQPAHVYVAPGDFHLELRATVQGAQAVLHQGPLVNFSRPSFDVLFHSASRVFGADLLAVVLTGMGSDGCGGCESVVASGGAVPLRAARDAARLARTPARHLGVDDLTTRSGPTPLHHGHDKLQPCPT